MQLSAANLLIASQQPSKAQAPAPKVQAQFSQALAKEAGTETFSALPLKQTAPPKAPAQQAPSYSQTQRLGSQLDIRI